MKQVWENMGVTQNIRTPVYEALRMKFAGWRYSSTLIFYNKQIVRTKGHWSFKWEIKLLPLEANLGHDETWSDMWIWVMRLCFSNEKSSLRCRICFFLRMFIRSFIAECTDTWQVQATFPFFTRYFWNHYPIWWFTLVVQTRRKYTFII